MYILGRREINYSRALGGKGLFDFMYQGGKELSGYAFSGGKLRRNPVPIKEESSVLHDRIEKNYLVLFIGVKKII